MGIKIPCHIFRFLLKLQLDSCILDSFFCNSIIEKFNANTLNTVRMTVSGNESSCTCFGSCTPEGRVKLTGGGGELPYNDIFSFLKYKDLMEFQENFIHNGFDQIDFIIIQMFSGFKFTKEILTECLHIYGEKEKNKVIKKLFEEKKNISEEYGLFYDEAEGKKAIEAEYGEEIVDTEKEQGGCVIF